MQQKHMRRAESAGAVAVSDPTDGTADELRQRARALLKERRFDLIDQLLASADLETSALLENLRIYQAELEIQNEELTRSQQQSQDALVRFSSFFNSLPVAELVVDQRGLVQEANLAAQSIFALRGVHLHQHFFARLVAEDDRARVVGVWSELVAERAVRLAEVHFRGGRDGGGFIADLHIAPLPVRLEGEPQFVCAVVDRTEAVQQRRALDEANERLRRSEAVLRESRECYRVLAEFSSDWEYWLDEHGRYRYVSPACLRMTGYTADDFMADPDLLSSLVQAEDLPVWEAHLSAVMRGEDCDATEILFRIHTRGGEERWFEHICNPVFDDAGRYLGRRGVNRDITVRRRVEEALQRSEDFLHAAGRLARVGGWELDAATDAMRWTRVTRELFGIPPDWTPSRAEGLERFHCQDRPRLQDAIERALTCGRSFDMQVRLMVGPDQVVWVQITCEPVHQDGRVVKLIGAIQDVSARVEAERSLRQAARVFESTAEGVMITDSERRVLAINRAFTEITGYSEEEMLGETTDLLRSGRHDTDFYRAMYDELARSGQWRGEIWNRHKDGRIYPALLTISAVLDSVGELTHYVGVLRDISDIKRSEERLEYLAHHDALTALPNRSLFQVRLEQCLQRASRYRREFAVLFLDLDRFKVVNDTLGHPVGDGLLQRVAETLAKQVRSVDTIARLGGDEFVILLEDVPASHFAAKFAARIMDTFGQPFSVLGHEFFVTASIGISVYPRDGTDSDTLLRHADIAMYQAKNLGRNGFRFFEAAMSEGAAERLRLEQDLRGAVQRNEFVLYYQPQLALDSRQLRGVEVLCRWHHPVLGLLPPSAFIPLAEDIGVIDDLGAWVLEHGCQQLADWDRAGFQVPRLAVNLSVREIERADLVEQVRSVLATTRIAPERLELEVTESMIMRHAEAAIAVLTALRSLGVTLAVDDFGTGYSSLAYLKRLPLNRLKIDRSFVERLTQDPNDDAIVCAVIALARSLGLAVLAEGVETREQVSFLHREGCGEGQGFLFSRPMTAAALVSAWSKTF